MARLNINNNQNSFVLRDYSHAAKTFTSEPGYEKLPYSGFLFHVNISFNNVAAGANINPKDVSVLIKAADLPEIQFETETLNQYNRKRIINKKVIYQPITLTFQDDVANNVRNMWIAYNQYYSADSNYANVNTWQLDNVYRVDPLVRNYGLDNKSTVPFINKIEIYSMGNHQYSKMLLVNPIINSAKFDDHEYSGGDKVMETVLTVEYENIIYSTGTTDNIPGFGSDNVENYDQSPSSLGLASSFETFGSANVSSSRTDNPITQSTSVLGRTISGTSSALNNLQNAAKQIDPIVGNVSKNNANLIENQYQQIKRIGVERSLSNEKEFVFPESSIANLNSVTLSSGLSSFNNIVSRSNQISSNGNNISATNLSNVSTTPVSTSANIALAELIISPIVPTGLNAAEVTLFNASFPPLPSTDPRVRQAPYV